MKYPLLLKELAEEYRMKPVTLKKHIAEGLLTGKKMGGKWLFYKEHIEAYEKNYAKRYGGRHEEN